MHSNLRNGLRASASHKRTVSLPTSSSLQSLALRTHNPSSTSCSGQRSFVSARRPSVFTLNTYDGLPEEKDEHFARMLMFGKPGSGKGTLTARLAQKYDILSLSTGDLLRQHIAERTDIGKEAEQIIARGELVSDEVVVKVITSKLDALQNKHWILDGFPRTVGQAELLDAHLKKRNMPLTLVVSLDVPDDIILSRISDRRVHLPSGRVYNMSYNRPRVEGFDDQTGEPLTKRPDDNLEVFTRRLDSFYKSTSPLLEYYSQTATSTSTLRQSHQHPHQVSFHRPEGLKTRTFRGTTSDDIWPQLDLLIKNSFPGLRKRYEPRIPPTKLLFQNPVLLNTTTTTTTAFKF